MYTLGGRQIVSDALRLCGARNVFADLALPAPQVGVEAVLGRDPAVILVGDRRPRRKRWQDWPQLPRCASGQVWLVPARAWSGPASRCWRPPPACASC